MKHYLKSEGLNFGMASPQRYTEALENAGFMNIKLRDRNDWYRKIARKEYEQMRGPLYLKMVDMIGYRVTHLIIWSLRYDPTCITKDEVQQRD